MTHAEETMQILRERLVLLKTDFYSKHIYDQDPRIEAEESVVDMGDEEVLKELWNYILLDEE